MVQVESNTGDHDRLQAGTSVTWHDGVNGPLGMLLNLFGQFLVNELRLNLDVSQVSRVREG